MYVHLPAADACPSVYTNTEHIFHNVDQDDSKIFTCPLPGEPVFGISAALQVEDLRKPQIDMGSGLLGLGRKRCRCILSSIV